MWWLVFPAKRTTLSSMLGQYRGPVDSIWPLYIGARCRLARMMSWMAWLVAPIQQWTCERGGVHRRLPIADCRLPDPSFGDRQLAIGNSSYSFKYENGSGSSS